MIDLIYCIQVPRIENLAKYSFQNRFVSFKLSLLCYFWKMCGYILPSAIAYDPCIRETVLAACVAPHDLTLLCGEARSHCRVPIDPNIEVVEPHGSHRICPGLKVAKPLRLGYGHSIRSPERELISR